MLKPLRLLVDSLKQFAIGFAPGLAMAFLCLAMQITLLRVIDIVGGVFFPSSPQPAFEIGSPEWMEELLARDGRYYYVKELIKHTTGLSILFFFHALVAVTLTSWLLRKRAGFEPGKVLRRAVRAAGVLTAGAAIVFAMAYYFDNVNRATSGLSFDFKSAGKVAVWFGATALLLPARLMGHQPRAASGFLRSTLVATIALVPWFYVSEVLGAPLRHCFGCGGFFEGGLVYIPMLGFYFLSLTVSSAAISAAACMPGETQPAPATTPALAV